jgi:hypothetical protein
VVHYDLPKDTEAFLHRSGRTGRAGKTGATIALLLPRDRSAFRRMCAEIKLKNVEYVSPPGPKAVMESSAKQVRHSSAWCSCFISLPVALAASTHSLFHPSLVGQMGRAAVEQHKLCGVMSPISRRVYVKHWMKISPAYCVQWSPC